MNIYSAIPEISCTIWDQIVRYRVDNKAVAFVCPEPDEFRLDPPIQQLYYSRYAVSVAQSLCCENSFSWPHSFFCPSVDGSQCLSGFFHRGKNGQGIKLTAHHLVSRLRMTKLYLCTSLYICGMERDSLTFAFITILGFLTLEHGTPRLFRNVC
jgi:hypothetical protein